jgi:hypothetical protein
MNPIKHPTNNFTFRAPEGMDDCIDLHVTRVDEQSGKENFSFWKPTPEELAMLNANGCVALSVFGSGHPPVWVGVATLSQEASSLDGVSFDEIDTVAKVEAPLTSPVTEKLAHHCGNFWYAQPYTPRKLCKEWCGNKDKCPEIPKQTSFHQV